jgi:hypothetical protein
MGCGHFLYSSSILIMVSQVVYWAVKVLLYRFAQSQLTHFRLHFCPAMGSKGAESACWERDDVMPFRNLFSDNGSVEHVACWVTTTIFMFWVFHGLYSHQTPWSQISSYGDNWKESPTPIQELKHAIRDEIATINQELLQMKEATFKMLSIRSNK